MRCQAALLLLACAGLAVAQSDFTPPRGAAHGFDREGEGAWQKRLLTATSTDGLTFRRTNQVVTDQGNVPDLIVDPQGVVYLYYSAGIAGDRNNVIAAAVSTDRGATWIYKYVEIEGTEGMRPGDPDVRLLDDGTFRLYFTSGVPGGRVPCIHYAEGVDGIHFVYKGQAFAREGETVMDSFTVPIGGKWHMYTLGNEGIRLWHAVSEDGRRFEPAGHPEFVADRRPYIPTNEMVLEDGRVRFSAFGPPPANDIRSFVTADGETCTLEEGVRLSVDESAGLEKGYVKDISVARLPDGTYLMVYVTAIPE